MRTIFATAALAAYLAAPGLARAKDYNYRVCAVEPTATGACLVISYDNVPRDQSKPRAALFVHTTDPKTSGDWQGDAYSGTRSKPGAQRIGEFDWVGSPPKKPVRVELDYGKLNLAPGQQIWTDVNFWWSPKGCHQWGDSVGGREAGGPHVLPQPTGATQNSRLKRRSPLLKLRSPLLKQRLPRQNRPSLLKRRSPLLKQRSPLLRRTTGHAR